MAKYCWSLTLKSMAHNNIAHDIVGKKQSIRYYFAFSQKPRKLYGNNVAEIIVIRHSVWSALDNLYSSNASRNRRGVFLLSCLRFPFRGCLIAERNKEHHAFFASWRD